MPPLLGVPARTTDLEAVQRGSDLILRWTVPSLTTDGYPIKDLERVIVLEVDADGDGANESKFDAGAQDLVAFVPPTPGAKIERTMPLPAPAGRKIALAVRNYGRRDRSAGLSNIAVLEIAPPPQPPGQPRAVAQVRAIHLEWPAAPGASAYQVFRAAGEKPVFSPRATVETPSFDDTDFQWNSIYTYFVRTLVKTSSGLAESLDSQIAVVVPRDTFPPSTPAGLQAVVGESVVELSWNLSPEPDTAGYNVYRQGTRLNTELLATPAYSDRKIQRNQQYSYTVSAVDAKGNESPQSAPVAVNIP